MALINTNIGPERVQVIPQPLGNVSVAGVATSVTGFLISSTLGGAPEQVATKVNTLEEFVELFGGADECGEAYYAVKGYYDNAGSGNTAIIVNVGSAPTALDYIGDGISTGLRAFDNEDILGLVCAPGLPLEIAYLVQPQLIDYCEIVRAEFGSTWSTSFSVLGIPKEITKADKEVAVIEAVEVDALHVTGAVVQLTGSPDLSVVTPGMKVKKGSTIVTTVTAVDNTLKTITLAGSFASVVAGDLLDIIIPSAVDYAQSSGGAKTSAWYFNPLLVLDESSVATPGSLITIDPAGHICGVMARIDANTAIGSMSHAPAGIQYAGIAGIQGLALTLSERLDAEPLRLAFINRITSFPGSGNIIFGGYTSAGMAATADEQLIQVVRSVQFIKGSLERGLRGFLWENFSPQTQFQVESAIQSFLRNNRYLFPSGLPETQQFKVIGVEPTQDELDQGLLRVRVQIKPNKAVRFIEVALEFPLPTV